MRLPDGGHRVAANGRNAVAAARLAPGYLAQRLHTFDGPNCPAMREQRNLCRRTDRATPRLGQNSAPPVSTTRRVEDKSRWRFKQPPLVRAQTNDNLRQPCLATAPAKLKQRGVLAPAGPAKTLEGPIPALASPTPHRRMRNSYGSPGLQLA
eukprot:4077082-Lingulodinium_polyedra.AAC.2